MSLDSTCWDFVAKLLASLALLLSFSARAYPCYPLGDFRIFGTVTDNEGQALPGVTMILEGPDPGAAYAQVSDADGRFRFYALYPGSTN